jgi:hypothetical protein
MKAMRVTATTDAASRQRFVRAAPIRGQYRSGPDSEIERAGGWFPDR